VFAHGRPIQSKPGAVTGIIIEGDHPIKNSSLLPLLLDQGEKGLFMVVFSRDLQVLGLPFGYGGILVTIQPRFIKMAKSPF
jgi:hypothetical protein